MPPHNRARTTEQHTLVQNLSKYDDDTFINVFELAALTGFSANSIRQRKIHSIPQPDVRMKHLRWRLGDVRAFIQGGIISAKPTVPPNGRATKTPLVDK